MSSKQLQITKSTLEAAITLLQLRYRPTNDILQLDLQMEQSIFTIVLGLINLECIITIIPLLIFNISMVEVGLP